MLILTNGISQEIFSCYQEIVDFIGNDEFNAILGGAHPQYSISFLPIT
jgi:hypothetical protein